MIRLYWRHIRMYQEVHDLCIFYFNYKIYIWAWIYKIMESGFLVQRRDLFKFNQSGCIIPVVVEQLRQVLIINWQRTWVWELMTLSMTHYKEQEKRKVKFIKCNKVPIIVLGTLQIVSDLTPWNTPGRLVLLMSIYKWENRLNEGLRNVPKATEPVAPNFGLRSPCH